MPQGMRFCRACGNRLGEGPAEYTETVRFPHATASGPQGSPFNPAYAAPLAQVTSAELPKKRKRISGMAWIFIVIGLMFALGGTLTFLQRRFGNRPSFGASRASTRSYVGVNAFEDAPGGVTFDNVEPLGSPAEKAGLVGGDIITSFDGHSVGDEDELSSVLRRTPIGKTVEVIYIRDGEIKKTQLTTISEGELRQLERAYENRPEGHGLFGFDDDRVTPIADPATRTYGVRLDNVTPNRSADLFGIKVGDIITAVDGVPIRTGKELTFRVQKALPKSIIEVTLIRNGETLKIPVTLGER
jgi:predicted metalloprotease with PDZ domain